MVIISQLIVTGHSMEPALMPGDRVFASDIAYMFKRPQEGDIVIVRNQKDGKLIVKRIQKEINGKYFLKGDNSKDSLDSRVFGLVEKRDIIAKVFGIIKNRA